jgi:hypothetical protein
MYQLAAASAAATAAAAPAAASRHGAEPADPWGGVPSAGANLKDLQAWAKAVGVRGATKLKA